MSRTVLAKVEGFTPVIDVIVKDTGSYMTALVFGRMWRYCQMKDGVCNATLEKMSDGLEMSRTAFMNHAKKLCDLGYLIDSTPDLRNKPHTYIDTGKAGLQVGVSANSHVNVVDVENIPHNPNGRDVNVVDTHVNVAHLKKEVKIDNNIESTTGEIFKVYQSEIGPLTGMIADDIGADLDTIKVNPEWFIDAMHEAALNGKRNWKYCRAILLRWEKEGKVPLVKPSNNISTKRQRQIEKLRSL